MQIPASILSQREQERQLQSYEGLIFTTTQLIVQKGVEMDFEDVQQLLRIKAWKAIDRFDPVKARGLTLDRYVFMCVFDERKTIEKKKRRFEQYIDDIAPAAAGNEELIDAFHQRYLSVESAEVYAGVEDELPLIPNTLTGRERWVLTLMMREYRQGEIAESLCITKREVESAVRSLRGKMADWRPPAASVSTDLVEFEAAA